MAREKTETDRHTIIRDTENKYPLPFNLVPGFGDQTPRTQVYDKETGNWGSGTGEQADQKAWDDLESKNHS